MACAFATRLRGERSQLNHLRTIRDNQIVSRHQGVDQDREDERKNAGRQNVLHPFFPTSAAAIHIELLSSPKALIIRCDAKVSTLNWRRSRCLARCGFAVAEPASACRWCRRRARWRTDFQRRNHGLGASFFTIRGRIETSLSSGLLLSVRS